MFVYQPKRSTLELIKTRALIMFPVGNQRGYIFLNLSHYTAFLHSMKLSGYRMRIKFDKDPLAVEQSNYLTKVVNDYIVYDLDNWPNILLRNFTLKIVCLA